MSERMCAELCVSGLVTMFVPTGWAKNGGLLSCSHTVDGEWEAASFHRATVMAECARTHTHGHTH